MYNNVIYIGIYKWRDCVNTTEKHDKKIIYIYMDFTFALYFSSMEYNTMYPSD